MFTTGAREAFRDWLIDLARSDARITAAAVLGSGAEGREDRWSDIDLAVRLAPGEDPLTVADSWTERVTERAAPVGHVDVRARGALYRVFLLPDTLQVDVSFWPAELFAAHSPRFRLVFGEANDPVEAAEPVAPVALGMAWLYALHVRSSLARGRPWQAMYFLNGAREHVIQLACSRMGLPTSEGRGVDDLPASFVAALAATMPAAMERTELQRAFAAVTALLTTEARHVDPDGVERLTAALDEMVRTCDPTVGDVSLSWQP